MPDIIRPVTWRDMAAIAVVALWAWGVGFWMAALAAFDDLDKRVQKIERGNR